MRKRQPLNQNNFSRSILFFAMAFLFLFTSCENFLDSEDVREEILETIEIANSNPVLIQLAAEEGSGIVSPATITAKKKQSFYISFVSSDNWNFIEWEAIDSKTGNALDDSIKFENKYSLNTKITILKALDNLLIRPKCLFIQVTPEESSKNKSNIPIKVQFNVPLDSITQNDIKIVYGGISLFEVDNFYQNQTDTEGQSTISLFQAPQLSEDKKSIIIKPNALMLSDFIHKQNLSLLKIELTLNNIIKSKKEEISIPKNLRQYNVWYEDSLEKEKPVINDFVITQFNEANSEKDLDMTLSSINENEKFYIKTIENFENNDFMKNCTNGMLYLWGRCYDKDSGVHSVIIYEKLTNSSDGNVLEDSELSFEYDKDDSAVEFLNDTDGNTVFRIKYNLQENEEDLKNGAVKLGLVVKDGAGNISDKKEVSVIKFKNTRFPDCKVFNIGDQVLIDDIFDIDYYNKNVKNLKISNITSSIYRSINFTAENYKFWCEYKDKNGNDRREAFSNYEAENNLYSLNLDVETVSDLSLKIIAIDDLGNTSERVCDFPPSLAVSSITKSSSTRNVYFCSNGKNIFNKLFMYWPDKNNPEILKGRIVNEEFVKIYESYGEVGIIPCNSLYGEINEDKYSFQSTSEPLDKDVSVSNGFTYSKSQIANYVDVNFTFREDTWEEFENIYFDCDFKNPKGSGTLSRLFCEPGKLSQSFSFQVRYFYDAEFIKLTFYGVKGKLRSRGTTYNLEAISPSDLEFDTGLPRVLYTVNRDSLTFTLSDDGVGPESCELLINRNYEFAINEENGFALSIPLYYFNQPENLIEYTARDKAGNEISRSMNYKQRYSSSYARLEHTESTNILYSDELFDDKDSSFGSYVYLEKLDSNYEWYSENDEFIKCNKSEVKGENGGSVQKLKLKDTIAVPDDSFVRITTVFSNTYSSPSIFYTGSAGPSNGMSDLLFENGNSKSSFAIQSDAPVFVHTLVTDIAYELCKDWTIQEWETNTKEIDKKLLPYSGVSDSIFLQRYDIPVEKIKAGECYCVIAHYANNKSLISQVILK